MTIQDIFDTFAHNTKITARLFSFADDKPVFKDTLLTDGNIDAFSHYSINCLVATGKNELLIELA